MSAYFELLRVYQYTKNLFIFLPLFFAFRITDGEQLLAAGLAFVAFSLVASAIYIINDFRDRDDDRRHPEKQHRPLASGRAAPGPALALAAALLVAGGALMASVALAALWLTVAYVALNGLYSLGLKHVAIVDIVFIATGFVIRLLVGAEVTGVPLSEWIIVMTFLLALFLSLAKRREDVLIFLKTDQKARRSVDGYNLPFLDAALVMTAAIVVLAYVLWSLTPEVALRMGERVYLTAVFVVLGVLRYMQITLVEERSGNPARILLRDRFLQAVLLGWFGAFVWLLYL